MIRECRCHADVIRCVHARGRMVLLITVPDRGRQLEYTTEGGQSEGDIWCFPKEVYGGGSEPHPDVSGAFDDWTAHLMRSKEPPPIFRHITAWDDLIYTDPELWDREHAAEEAAFLAWLRGEGPSPYDAPG